MAPCRCRRSSHAVSGETSLRNCWDSSNTDTVLRSTDSKNTKDILKHTNNSTMSDLQIRKHKKFGSLNHVQYKLQKNFDTKKFCITDTLIFFIKKDAHKLIEICQNYVMMKGENFNVSRNIALIHAIFFNISYRTIFFNIPYEN